MLTHPIQFAQHKSHASALSGAMHTLMHMKKVGNQLAHSKSFGGKFVMSHPKSTGDKNHDALVTQTEKWVAQTFFGELLKQMRNSPFKSDVFDGGKDSGAFSEMFDQQLADRMSRGAGKKLVDSIVNKIEAGKAYAANAPAKAKIPSGKPHVSAQLMSRMGAKA